MLGQRLVTCPFGVTTGNAGVAVRRNLPLLKRRVAYCFFETSSIIFWLLVWYRQARQG